MNLIARHTDFLKQAQLSLSNKQQREDFLQIFQNQGLPTKRIEEWHYTSLKSLANVEATPVELLDLDLTHEQLEKIQDQLPLDFDNIVFINGKINSTLSAAWPLMVQVEVNEKINIQPKEAIEALNFSFTNKYYQITFRSEYKSLKPLNFVFYQLGKKGISMMGSPHVELIVEKGAHVVYMESYIGENYYLTNSWTKIKVASGARVQYFRQQNESDLSVHLGGTYVDLDRGAFFESLSLSTGSELSRHNIYVNLNGPQIECNVYGLYIGAKNQHMDHYTQIHHRVGECQTRQLYKGILDDEARAIFTGKIIIDRNAQKASSEQLNNNLILSSKAEVNSRPMLEILADDVKATHGSTIGQLNEEEIFYLQSRGILTPTAMQMMSFGFLAEVIEKIDHPQVTEWLKKCTRRSFENLINNKEDRGTIKNFV